MTNYKYAKNLRIGDLIVVSTGNYMTIGFFAGLGSGTIQFYTPTSVINWKEYGMKKPYASYIGWSLHRIAKVNIDDLDDSLVEELMQAKQIMIEKGMISNF
jgi:hypothetical protein